MRLSGLLVFAGLIRLCRSIDTGAPKGVPIGGNYNGPLRPQIHFSSPVNFMNDPNGFFHDDLGVYHLYYQCTIPDPHLRNKLIRKSTQKRSRTMATSIGDTQQVETCTTG
jgi:hypothetical protein